MNFMCGANELFPASGASLCQASWLLSPDLMPLRCVAVASWQNEKGRAGGTSLL